MQAHKTPTKKLNLLWEKTPTNRDNSFVEATCPTSFHFLSPCDSPRNNWWIFGFGHLREEHNRNLHQEMIIISSLVAARSNHGDGRKK